MDFQELFFSANGRIGRKSFWIGVIILFVVNLVIRAMTFAVPAMGQPIISGIVLLVLMYLSFCVYAKRLHDMGKTAKLMILPCGAAAAMYAAAYATGGMALLGAMLSGNSAAMMGSMGSMGSTGSMGLFGIIALCAGLISIVFWLWAGIAGSQPGDNVYGPAETAAA